MALDQTKTGTAAIISIIAAIGSYILTFTGNPILGLLVAIIAIPIGGVGLFMSASPRVKGGPLSILAVVLAIGAIGVAVLGMIGVLIF